MRPENWCVLVISPHIMLRLQWLAVSRSKFNWIHAYLRSNVENHVLLGDSESLIRRDILTR